ncbi:isochorismatase hydrolase [Cryptococcus neoformans]|nr:isochorismatase hydrolase [Cryptococcus neoformans var. grubii]OXH63282.1 isochorismatase hydrolase [Cryptococcus neoformans var. grubii]
MTETRKDVRKEEHQGTEEDNQSRRESFGEGSGE